MSLSNRNAVAPMTAAQRAREFRRRRRDRMRLLSIELREEEIDDLVRAGMLRAEHRDDCHAVMAALYGVLDRAFDALARGTLPERST